MEKLTTWRKTLEAPTLENAARLLGVSAVQVHRYEKGDRRIPAERAAQVEAITGIPRHELRPDIFPAPEAAQ